MENENIVNLNTKLADCEAEINELENLLLENKNPDKNPRYKKDLVSIKSRYTKINNKLNKLYENNV